MSAAEAVGALPGGGAFTEIWDKVNGDAGAVSALGAALSSAAERADESSAHLKRASGEVGEAWSGPASAAFTGYMSRFGAAGSKVGSALDHAATALHNAAEAVSTAKEAVDAVGNRILDQVGQVRARSQDDPDQQKLLDTRIRQIVQEGCSEAEPHVTTLTSTLGRAASTIKGTASVSGFLDLHATDDGTYLPPKGQPVQWRATPKHSAATGPAGGGGGGGGGSAGGGGSSSAGGRGGPSSGGPPQAQPTGDVKTWIDQAIKILEQHGVKPDQLSAADINTIISHESGGNPHAENDWDSNAAAGHPSKGLMQTIDSTFDAHSLPGHTDIWNPVDNIIAGVRYAISRYGSLDNVPGIRAVHNGGSYVGY